MLDQEIEILQDKQAREWVQDLLQINQDFLALLQNEAEADNYTPFLDQRDQILEQLAACPSEQRRSELIPELESVQTLDKEIESLLKQQQTKVQTEHAQVYKSHAILRAYQPEEPTDAYYIEEES